MAITNEKLAELMGAVTSGADNTATLNAAYQKAFGRDADADGLTYWGGRLDDGLAVADLMTALLGGVDKYPATGTFATENTADKAVVVNKTAVAEAIEAKTFVTAAEAATILATVTSDAATVTSATASVDAITDPALVGDTFVLTTGTDSLVGTALNDTFTAANGTLGTVDTILDSSSTDSDTLNAIVTSAGAAPRLQNIETVNVDGLYATTGMDLASTSGTVNLNLNTGIVGGTATVLNAGSLNAVNINAGTNIGTLTVTATASGTRDTVNVNAGSAASVTINGNAGTDTFSTTVATGTSVTLGINGGTADIDAHTINATGGTLTLAGDAAAKTVTINNTTAALTATLTTGQTVVGTVATSKFDITGDAAVTLVTADTTDVDGIALTTSGTGATTLKITDTAIVAGEADLNEMALTTVNLAGTATGAQTVTVNEGTIVNLTKDTTGGATDVTLNVDNAAGDLAAGAGTLLLNVSENQDAGGVVVTGAKVGTLVLTATPDEATDTDSNGNGIADTNITITELDTATSTNTETVVISGSENLTITTFTNDATSSVLSAAGMTGNLTIGTTTAAGTYSLGSGTNNVTVGAASTIHGGSGVDTITGSAANDTINGNAGNDVINAKAGTNTINAGAGDDIVTVDGGTDTITLGAGNDTVISAVNTNYTVTDINTSEDTLVITGTATTAVDLTSVTPSTGAYKVSNTGGVADFTLTGSTATDISSFVQLGNSTTAFTAAAGLAVTAGAKDDVIAVDGANTITTGAGSDTIIVGTLQASATVADFTVGSDKVILTGALTADASINLGSVTITSNEHVFAGTHEVTLKSDATTYITATDVSSMVQLGTSAVAFATAGTAAVSVTGGSFNDFIELGSTAANTVNFIDNGGMDTISSFTTGTDKLSFDGMTGISATAGSAATTTKIADAQDGSVYVFGNVVTTAYAGEKVSTFTVDTDGNTADAILADVAALLEASLGEADGENYIAIMNDGTSSYAYLVNADADGIDAADITLIGKVDTGVVAVGDIA